MNDTHNPNDFSHRADSGTGTPQTPQSDGPEHSLSDQNAPEQSLMEISVPPDDTSPDTVVLPNAPLAEVPEQSSEWGIYGQEVADDEPETDIPYNGGPVPRIAAFKPLPQEDFAGPSPPNGRNSITQAAPSAPLPSKPSHEQEMDLLEHLGELRTRLIRCICAVGLMMVVTWAFRDQLLAWFAYPIVSVLEEYTGKGFQLITVAPGEGFLIYLQITFAAALLLTAPYVLWEIWGFVEPALTHQERRYTSVLVPFSVILFMAGAFLGYFMTPVFFRFFIGFQPPGSVANYSYGIAVTLLSKMLLVFGVCFQVPVVTIFVNKTGLVSRNLLIEYWRHVVVVIFIAVSIITPTWDPVTLLAAAVPPCLLYAVSIWMVKWL